MASQPGEQGSGGNGGTGGASNAGTGGSIAAAGTGGSIAAAGTGSGGRGAGGSATAGTTGAAGSGSGGVAGSFSVDAGTMGPQVGVRCEEVICAPGQACILCRSQDGSTSQRMCVPHPIDDPLGYAEATTGCAESPIFNDCDGPEDCDTGEYCVAREGADGFQRCRSMPSTVSSCCFSCGALTDCTLCNTSEDCPDEQICEPVEDELLGCLRSLPDP